MHDIILKSTGSKVVAQRQKNAPWQSCLHWCRRVWFLCASESVLNKEPSGGLSVRQCVPIPQETSALGASEEAADPSDQGLDEGVAGADLPVQTLHLQQLPLESLPEAR